MFILIMFPNYVYFLESISVFTCFSLVGESLVVDHMYRSYLVTIHGCGTRAELTDCICLILILFYP